jgi:hypothetical protein
LTITVPTLPVRALVERLKKLSAYVTVGAHVDGQLTFRVRTDSLELESTFRNLPLPELGNVRGWDRPGPLGRC